LTNCPVGAGTREGGCAGGFPPEVPIEFCDVWKVTVENCARYVRFKRPKRCNRFLDNALSALEVFTNLGVYTGISHETNYKNNSPQGCREEISAKGASRGEISEGGVQRGGEGGRAEGAEGRRGEECVLCDELREVEREVERWWERRIGSEFPEYLKAITPLFVLYLQYASEHKVVVVVRKEEFREEEKEEFVYLDYTTRFHDIYKRRVAKKLSGIEFKRCTHLTLTTDLKQYREIRSATRALKRRWDTVLKRLKREADRFHKLRERYESGDVSEEEFDEYKRNECVFELKYGEPPSSKEMRFLCVLEFSLERGHGSPHLHILLEDVFLNVNGIRLIRELMEGHCGIIKVRRYFNLNISGYVMKYVKKVLVVKRRRDGSKYYTSEIKKFIHASLYWITGCRMFSISRSLQEEIKKRMEEKDVVGERKGGRGEYIGVVPAIERSEFSYSIEDAVQMWYLGVAVHLNEILWFDHKYWSSRIKHVWSVLLSDWYCYI